jgi:sulfate transport system substrate-binding protein
MAMNEGIIPQFEREWRKKTGQEVRVITSYAGSGTITNQIVFGAPAQVAMVSTEIDALNIRKSGLTTTDWRGFPNQGTFAYTTTVLLTRKGNPHRIHSFEDTAKEKVNVVYPDPTTSGGAQWAILALYGAALKTSEADTGTVNSQQATELVRRISRNARSLPESARAALGQFALGYGDVLLTYENEALLDIAKGKGYELVVPRSTIYIEPKIVVIDKNVKEREKDLARGFVDFLWTPLAQETFARYYFRVWNDEIMKRYAAKYPEVQLPFTVEYLGGWEEATAKIIEQDWRQVQREIR